MAGSLKNKYYLGLNSVGVNAFNLNWNGFDAEIVTVRTDY